MPDQDGHATFECPACGDRHDVPRDPAAYHPTRHYQARYRERDVPEGAAADCLRGDIKVCADADTRFAEGECADGRRWRFVFGLGVDACPAAGATLPAMTIYPAPD